MSIPNNLDILIVIAGIILLSLDKQFESRFRYIIPVAASYVLLRFFSLSSHYQTGAVFHLVVICSQWILAIIFFQLNGRRITAILIFLGSMSNLSVVAANDLRMPCKFGDIPDKMPAGYAVMSQHTHLNILGDWMKVNQLNAIFSVGDILILMGLISLFICYIWLKLYKTRSD